MKRKHQGGEVVATKKLKQEALGVLNVMAHMTLSDQEGLSFLY